MTGQALTGRRIVVLGGTGGFGHEVTARFRDDGASVVVADARAPREDRRHDGVEYVTVDVLDEASVAAAFATSPPPQAIVNLIGGYTPPQPLSGLDVSVLRQQLEVNLVTAAIVTKHAMPVLAAQDGGALVHVSSRVAAEKGENGFAYSVSKLGVVRLVEAAAAEGREQGAGQLHHAEHHRHPGQPGGDAGRQDRGGRKPSQLAAVLAFLVSDEAILISGAAIPSTAGPRPMTAMRFDAATSRRIESSYATPDVVEQRRAIIGALSLQPGERVLDIGSGPGSFLRDGLGRRPVRCGDVASTEPGHAVAPRLGGGHPPSVTFGRRRRD